MTTSEALRIINNAGGRLNLREGKVILALPRDFPAELKNQLRSMKKDFMVYLNVVPSEQITTDPPELPVQREEKVANLPPRNEVITDYEVHLLSMIKYASERSSISLQDWAKRANMTFAQLANKMPHFRKQGWVK